MTQNRVIGNAGKLPWRIPEELQYFKQITIGNPIVMGRKTFDSIQRRLLPNRTTIVLSKQPMESEGFYVANTISQVMDYVKGNKKLMIIGGATIYQQFLPLATHMYLSLIKQDYPGDSYFPEYNEKEWQLTRQTEHDEFIAQILSRC